jgi:hypothetical protein
LHKQRDVAILSVTDYQNVLERIKPSKTRQEYEDQIKNELEDKDSKLAKAKVMF